MATATIVQMTKATKIPIHIPDLHGGSEWALARPAKEKTQRNLLPVSTYTHFNPFCDPIKIQVFTFCVDVNSQIS